MKMKFSIYKLWIVIGVMALQSSCSEDLLEPKPLSFFAPENVFDDESGYEASLVTMRKALTEGITGSRRYYMVGNGLLRKREPRPFRLIGHRPRRFMTSTIPI